MPGEKEDGQDARRKRVQALKKMIILAFLTALAVPLLLCVILFVRVSSLERRLGELTGQLERLNGALEGLSEASSRDGEEMMPAMAGTTEERTDGTVSRKGEGMPAEARASGAVPAVSYGDASPVVHKVYLTFDDGPSAYTDDILDILDRYDVKATFFVLGKEDELSRQALKEIVARGHTLGMHSYSHKYTEIYESVDAFSDDFIRLQDYLFDVTGVRSIYYRFPGGSSNTVSDVDMHEFADYLEGLDVNFYDWNISSGDGGGKLLDVQTLVDNSIQGIEDRGTNMILLHDSLNKRTTVEALPIIIESIQAMENTVILPITEDTEPIQHIHKMTNN